MGQKNSQIILCSGINMDREYNNVIDKSEAEILALCQSHAIASRNNYSFIRPQNVIYTDFTYAQTLQANYIAFQNPDYDNKWFFAWIDDVEYVSDSNVKISYTIDAWSTWYDYLTVKQCYVLREMVIDDEVGANTIEEGIDTGEFICNKKSRWLRDDNNLYDNSDMVIVLGATENFQGENNEGVQTDGIYAGLRYYVFHNNSEGINVLNTWLQNYAQKGTSDAIKCLFMLPEYMIIGADRSDHLYAGTNLVTTRYINTGSTEATKNIDLTNNNLDGYIPKNNKLLCYPYNYLIASNNNGTDVIYRLEDFYTKTNDNKTIINPQFKINSCVTPSGSIRMIPLNFKGIEENDDEGINLGKFPICSWQTDVYTNWLTQNGTNVALNLLGGVLGIASSVVAPASAIGIATSSLSVASTIGDIYRQSKIPNQVSGNINCGDVISASGKNDFIFYNMCIKKEYAQIIDDYFTRFGYKINRVKLPNINNRPYWNYLEIGSSEEIGVPEKAGKNRSIPTPFWDTINNACRKGVTIWHNHDNIGNYNLDNRQN